MYGTIDRGWSHCYLDYWKVKRMDLVDRNYLHYYPMKVIRKIPKLMRVLWIWPFCYLIKSPTSKNLHLRISMSTQHSTIIYICSNCIQDKLVEISNGLSYMKRQIGGLKISRMFMVGSTMGKVMRKEMEIYKEDWISRLTMEDLSQFGTSFGILKNLI